MTSTVGLPGDQRPASLDDVTATVERDENGDYFVVGYVVRWRQAGQTSAGRLWFERDRIELPRDLSRVKLLVEHRTGGQVIGHGAEARPDDVGLWMRLAVPDPDRAGVADTLRDVEKKLRDAFSPGVELDDATRVRLRRAQFAPVSGSGRLREVSLVAIPGFDDWGPGEDDDE